MEGTHVFASSSTLLKAMRAVVLLVAFAAAPAVAGTTGSIQGFATDNAGHPIASVQVSVAAATFRTTTVTGPNGFYAVNGLPVDTYMVTFSRPGFQTQAIPGVTVLQDQAVRVNVQLAVELKTLARVAVRGASSLVQPTVTADTYAVNQQTLQNINGTPQDPNGFQALNSLPGVTTDNFGYPIIRAGQENDVGYEYEGINNTDPVTGQFLNSVSLNGVRSIQLSTGGYDVSSGNTNSGVINQVLKRGSYPPSGQATARVFAPIYGHELSFDWGNATPDNKFSYYLSFGLQRDGSAFGDGKTVYPEIVALQNFFVTDDDVVNMYYHFGKNQSDELQVLSDVTNGDFIFGTEVNQNQSPYDSNNQDTRIGLQLTDANGNQLFDAAGNPITLADYITLYPGQAAYKQNVGYIDSQSYNSIIDKINYKRQFTPSSFGEVRLFKTVENLIFRYPYNVGSFSGFYEDLATQGLGEGFDYNNQLNDRHNIGIGGDYTTYISRYQAQSYSFEPFGQSLESTGCPQISGLPPGNGGCYIGPLNAAINNGTTPVSPALPTSQSLAPMPTFINDAFRVLDPVHNLAFYVKDLFQPSDRFTADIGLRYDQQIYDLPSNAAQLNTAYFNDVNGNYVTFASAPLGPEVTRPSQLSPRLALTYKLNDRNVLRFSYGKNIEFEPESGIEQVYSIPAQYQNCTVANGCFQPLNGFPGFVCGSDGLCNHSDLPATNHISNLYQSLLVDENTNDFQQYTPVRPQRAVNLDASIEHDFGDGMQLKITPYYRKGTDYVVGSSDLKLVLSNGTPIFGPTHFPNAGVNENTGAEFDFTVDRSYGLSGFVDATYDNTLANYDSDFFPTVNSAALAAGHFFHVSYVAPVTGTLNLEYNTKNGYHVSMNMPYESGYRYGVGKKVYVFANACDPSQPAIPVLVLNTDLARNTCAPGSVQDAYYYTDPSNPGTVFAPHITGSRGTPDGDDPGSLHGNPLATVNVSIAKDLGQGANYWTVGMRVENLLGNYSPASPSNNPWYLNNGLGGYAPGSGTNPNIGFEPYQYNLSANPYENEPIGVPRTYTFFVSTRY
jgi:outer membrane receptor protein involved in Fe transport